MPTTMLRSLLNVGVLANDAQVLEGAFANEPDFLLGLEQVARALATGALQLVPPQGEPWCTIYLAMQQPGISIDTGYAQILSTWAPGVQAAISGAVSVRMQDIQQWAAAQLTGNKGRKTDDYLRILTHLGYTFKYNQVTSSIEVNGEKLTTRMRQQIRNKMRSAGVKDLAAMEDAYGGEARAYHPIKDYLHSLKYEGGDPIGDVAAHFTCDYGMFPTWLKRWMVGACAKVMAAEENRMLVLDGPQNIGKSHFVRWLASPLEKYFIEGGVDTASEDIYRRLGQRWIWEVSELGASTRKSDWEALKAFITMRTVTTRLKYDREDTDMPALASLFGTINNEEGFLPTGDRRFYVERVTKIDWAYKKIEVGQLWAQAFDLYLAGEPWEPQGAERDQVQAINEDYRMLDMVEEVIKQLFEIDPQQVGWTLSSLEVMEAIKAFGLRSPGEIDTRRLSRALTKLGLDKPRLIRTKGTVLRGYSGIKRRI